MHQTQTNQSPVLKLIMNINRNVAPTAKTSVPIIVRTVIVRFSPIIRNYFSSCPFYGIPSRYALILSENKVMAPN